MEQAVIKRLLKSDDELIRCDTIEKICEFIDNTEIQEIIFDALNDKSFLVRCEAYEGIGNIRNKKAWSVLMGNLHTEEDETAITYMYSPRFAAYSNLRATRILPH